MSLFKNIKAFLLKEDFDILESENVDMFNFHPQLRVFFAAMGVFSNNRNSRLRLVYPIFSIMFMIMGFVFEFLFVLHGFGVKDYAFATECFCYQILAGAVPVLYIAVLLNKDNILHLLDDMNGDFIFICSLASRYRVHFLEGQLIIYKLCYAWLLTPVIIAIAYISMCIGPLIYQSLFATQNEYMTRPLIFPMWLPEDDPYRTPNYEIFLCIQLCFIFMFIQSFCVYVYLQFHVLLHHIYLLDIMIMHLEVIFEDQDESVVILPRCDPRRIAVQHTLSKRMGRVVIWHCAVFKSVTMVSSVLGPPLCYQVLLTSVATCLMAYQIADSMDQGKVNVRFGLLLLATVVQLWIPCYLCTLLRNKGFAVGDACWNNGWETTPLGQMLCRDIIIVMLRSQQPLSIRFTGLPEIQLETFSSIMSTAYSYFNMLRSTNEK